MNSNIKKLLAGFLSASVIATVPGIDVFSVKASAAAALTINGGDSNNHFEDKRENYINPYFKYEQGGKEVQTGTVINTVTFEFASSGDMGLEIYAVSPYGDHLINAVDVSDKTSYKLDFPLGGEFKARLVENGTAGDYVEFSVEIPDTDGDGDKEFAKDWAFIEYLSDKLFDCEKTIDVSKFNIPYEDNEGGVYTWETWNAFMGIKDWNGIIGNVSFGYKSDNGFLTEINVDAYYVDSSVNADEEYNAYTTYVKTLMLYLFPDGEYFTDLEKAVIIYDYFRFGVGNIYGEGGNAYNALWYKDALCDGCARAFSLLCQLSGLNSIKGGSGVAAHAWNIVQIDGNWYQLDPLWGGDSPSEYFLKTDEEFIADHNGQHNKYGTSQIFWGRTLTESFPSCTDETFKDDKWIFRKASAHIFYQGGKFYYYIKNGDEYKVYASEDLIHEESEFVRTVGSLNEFWSFVEPYGYCYLSDDNVSTGEAVYFSPGAFYYTNEGDPTDSKYRFVGVRPTLENMGIVTDYKLEVYDSSDNLLTTMQAAMYRLSVLSFNKPGTYNVKILTDAVEAVGRAAEATITITVTGEDISTGDDDIVVDENAIAEYVVWTNGGKQKLENGSSINHKTAVAEPTIEATNWTDDKGKTKKGKLVWTASLTPQQPVVDDYKHTVTTKSDKTVVTVSNGKISAKSAGETGEANAYVYATDTGSLKSEAFFVTVKNAPSTIFLFDSADKTADNKKDKLKSVTVVAGGDSEKVYIVPFAKQGAVSDDCTYTISAKKNDDGIITFSEIKTDENGKMYFEVKGNKLAAAGKVSKISLTVTCDQSAKKSTLSVNVTAPVEGVSMTGTGTVATKGSTADFGVVLKVKGDGTSTSDKIQVVVSESDPVTDQTGKKVTAVKSKQIIAKLSKDMKTVTLKASADVTSAQGVYFIVTNPATKLKSWLKAADISADGVVTVIAEKAPDDNSGEENSDSETCGESGSDENVSN